MLQTPGLRCSALSALHPGALIVALIFRMAVEFILSIEEGAAMDSGVHKLFSVKCSTGHYYVQEMPGYWDIGRDYVVMRNRRQLSGTRHRTCREAVAWLLAYLSRELSAETLFPRENCQI